MFLLKHIAHAFCWIGGKTLFKFFLHFQVTGKENLKGLKGPLIVAFNHAFWLDPLFVNAAVPPTSKLVPIRFATWYKHYWKFLPFTFASGAFPVKKGIGLENSLKEGLKILKKGGVVGIAPEEKRRHFGRRRNPRRGVAFLALKTGAPILPVLIKGSIGLNTSKILSRKGRVTVRIGERIPCPRQRSFGNDEDLEALAKDIMERVYRLENG